MTEQSLFLSEMIVGVVLQDASLLAEVLQSVTPTDLDPPYSVALGTIIRVRKDNPSLALDPWTLQEAIAGASPGLAGDFVATTATRGVAAALGVYLSQFREGIARRRLAGIALTSDTASRMSDLRLGIERVKEAVADTEGVLAPQRIPLIDGDMLWDYTAPPESVLMPGLLWRQGRVMITGFEGDGKSILLRQLAMAGALGIHPFKTHGRIDPIRTLYLDLENPPALAQSVMRTMLETLRDRRVVPDHADLQGRFMFDIRTDGLDIVGRGRDREYLSQAIATHRPDLLCVGPIYRLAAGGGDLDEATVSGVLDFLNHLRATYDIAIATEAHAPHGASDGANGNSRRVLRPSGSSVWMRFPEVGRGLREDTYATESLGRLTYRLEPWRKDRSTQMRFPNYIARAVGGQIWFDDVSDEVMVKAS